MGVRIIEARQKIQEILTKAEEDVQEFVTLYHESKLEVFPGRSAEETLELKILEVLNKARNETGNIIMENPKRTHAYIMAEAGARGNFLNLIQMAALVGQQAMRGKRIEKG